MNENSLNSKEILETQISEIQGSAAASAPAIPSPAPEKSHSATGWKIATFIFALLAVAGLGFGVFELLTANQAPSTPEPVVSTTDTTDDDVRALIDELEKDLAFESTVYKIWGEYFLGVKEEGMKTHMALSRSYGLAFAYPDNLPADIENRITAQLTKRGFTEQGEIPLPGGGTLYKNQENGIVCSVDGSAFPLSCGHISWVDEDEIEINNELAEAFYQKEGEYPFFVSAGEVKDSTVAPYQKMYAGVENAAGLFYRVNEDAEWQFFTGTQAELDCSDYNTEDIKNAFAGDVCWDATTGANSIVQP